MSSGTPYIGSKISLVSKAEIRYEGFLYTIDQNDSTVTLAKVISLGTEDRVPDSPVPAREEVFEYIVFRGSDIKDLHVCEGPKRVDDPAIVHQSSQSYSQNYNHPSNYHHHRSPFGHGGPGHGPGPGGIPNFNYNPFNFHPNGPADVQGNRQHTPPNLPRADSRSGQPKNNQIGGFQDNNRGKVRGNDGRFSKEENHYSKENRENSSRSFKENRNDQYDDSRDHRGNKDRDSKNNKDNRSSRGTRESENKKDQHGSNQENGDKYEGRERKDTGGDRERKGNKDRDSNRYIKDNRNYRDNSNRYRQNRKENQEEEAQKSSSETRGGPRGGRGGRGYSGRGSGRGRGAPRGGGNNRTKFTEDFDFETANAKFDKEKIEEELLKVLKKVKIKDESGEGTELKDECDERESDERAPLPSPDKFYDRSKSFFDNILCEAMVPKTDDEVMTRRQEQALNAETFGNSASHFRSGYRGRGGRGRGRWRGQGRGGFYRGGRGGNNYRGNSNRRWVDYEFDYKAAGIENRHQPIKTSNGGMD